MSLELLGVRDINEDADENVGDAPAYAWQLSPGGVGEFHRQVAAYYAQGMKPDDIDRVMTTYGPNYFEDRARAGRVVPVARAAGATAFAVKSCGADGDPQSWLLVVLCFVVLLVACLIMSRVIRALAPVREGASS